MPMSSSRLAVVAAFVTCSLAATAMAQKELPYSLSEAGYSFAAAQQCANLDLVIEWDAFTQAQREFKSGMRNFNYATKNRSLEWACGAALRLFDGTRGLGPAILVAKERP